MQQKNFIAFLILSVVILVGWSLLQQQLWPVRPKKPADKKEQKEVVKGKDKKEDKKEEKNKAAAISAWDGLRPEARNAILAALTVTSSAGNGSLTAIPAYLERIEQVKRITLGGKGYFLEAVVTSQGAGLQKLTLKDFKAADRLGRPLNKSLDLIQDDPFRASFLLYHFPKVEEERAKRDKFPPVPTLGERLWNLEDNHTNADGVQTVRFSTRVPPPYSHLVISKEYRLAKGDYHIGLSIMIEDTRRDEKGGAPPAFRYQLAGAHGLPIEGEWYATTYRNSFIGESAGRRFLSRTMEDARTISHRAGGQAVPDNPEAEVLIQYAGVADQYFASLIVVDDKQADKRDGGVDATKILAWGRPTRETKQTKGIIRKISADKATVVIAEPRDVIYQLLPRARELLESQKLREGDLVVATYYYELGAHGRDRDRRLMESIRRGREPHPFANDITVRVNSDRIVLEPGQKVVHKFLLYNGPLKVRLLDQMGAQSPDSDLVNRYADTLHLSTLTDVGNFGPWTELIIFCTKVMHWLLFRLHFLGYGLAIIFLTILVRSVMFPISRKQALMSMKMQELAPEMKKLQEKYKSDPKARTEAVMELYRKHHVHPLGGCLPLILQLPIFMGLYYALQESIHFRQASFLWIDNLSAPDCLIWWGENIPLISDPDNLGSGLFSFLYLGPYFSLLPVLAVALMIVQQKMLTPPPADEQQAMQFKMMRYMMVVIGLMFYKVAAGLCLYFIASSLWGVAERKLLPKKKAAFSAAQAPVVKPSPNGPRTKPRALGKKDAKKELGAIQQLIQRIKDWWAEVLKQARKK